MRGKVIIYLVLVQQRSARTHFILVGRVEMNERERTGGRGKEGEIILSQNKSHPEVEKTQK